MPIREVQLMMVMMNLDDELMGPGNHYSLFRELYNDYEYMYMYYMTCILYESNATCHLIGTHRDSQWSEHVQLPSV